MAGFAGAGILFLGLMFGWSSIGCAGPPAGSDEAVASGREGQNKPLIKIVSPNGGEVWAEGETHDVLWDSEGVTEVRITVAVGGKDKGHLGEGVPIDAGAGRFAWTIPRDFVTGFGISEAGNVRVMIYDARDRQVFDISDGPFTITGPRPAAAEEAMPPAEGDRDYEQAIVGYFDALSGREFKRAYDMLSACKVVLTNADGSAVAFRPRPGYESWLEAQQNVRTIEVRRVERLIPATGGGPGAAGRGDALATLGIRAYKVTLSIELSREDWTVGSGENTLFVYVVKGSDGMVRILEIGSGP